MPQPYNYAIQQIDPFGSALKGMQTGMAFNQAEQQQAQQKQNLAIQEQTIRENEQKLVANDKAVADKAKMDEKIADLVENFSVTKARKIGLEHPGYFDKIKDILKDVKSEEKEKIDTDMIQLYNLANNNPKRYVEELNIKQKALNESKDPEQQKQGRVVKGLYESAKLNLDANKIGAIKTQAALSSMAVIGIDKWSKWTQTEADAELKKEQARLLERKVKVDEQKNVIALKQVNADEVANDIEKNKLPEFTKKDEETFRDEQKSWSATRASLIGINSLKKSFPKAWKGGFLNAKMVDVESWLGTLDKEGVKKQSFMHELRRIAVKQGLAMRDEGSGSTSDVEFTSYMSTVPDEKANDKVIANWLQGFQDRVKRRSGQSKIMLKWMDIHNGSRGSKGGIEIIPGLPKTEKGELPQEYMERIGSMGVLAPSEKSLDEIEVQPVVFVAPDGSRISFPSKEKLDAFKAKNNL